jgi:hypothetical protein
MERKKEGKKKETIPMTHQRRKRIKGKKRKD